MKKMSNIDNMDLPYGVIVCKVIQLIPCALVSSLFEVGTSLLLSQTVLNFALKYS